MRLVYVILLMISKFTLISLRFIGKTEIDKAVVYSYIYVNEKRFHHTMRSDLMSENVELVAVEINQPKSAPIIVLAWYRPPGSSIIVWVHRANLVKTWQWKQGYHTTRRFIYCDLLAHPQSCYTKKLLEVCNRFSLDQVIDKPTRVVQNSQTLIDAIFISNSSKVTKCGVFHTGISDHSLVYIIWGKSRSTQTHHVYKKYRRFKNFSESNFQDDVSKIEWNRVYSTSDTNESANEFQNWLLNSCNKNAPVRKKKVKKNNLPWINADILRLMRERDSIKNKAIKTNTDDEWKSYKKMRNYVTARLKYVKKWYFQSRIDFSKGNVKQTWRHLNILMSRNSKSSDIASFKSGDIDISDPKQIAETLNDFFFVNKGPSLANDIPPSNDDMPYTYIPFALNSTFCFERVALEEIMKILKSIQNDKATGYDMLPVKLIKSAAESITHPLTYIINS